MSRIDAALLVAHAAGDGTTMMQLYTQAAAQAKSPEATAFYLTHAYVFALESGHANAAALHQRLIDAGCEHPAGPPRPPKR